MVGINLLVSWFGACCRFYVRYFKILVVFFFDAVRRLVDSTQIGMTAYGDMGLRGGSILVISRKHAGMKKIENLAQIRWG